MYTIESGISDLERRAGQIEATCPRQAAALRDYANRLRNVRTGSELMPDMPEWTVADFFRGSFQPDNA